MNRQPSSSTTPDKTIIERSVPPPVPHRDLFRSRSTFETRPSLGGNHNNDNPADEELRSVRPKPRLSVRSIVDNLELTAAHIQRHRRRELQLPTEDEETTFGEPIETNQGPTIKNKDPAGHPGRRETNVPVIGKNSSLHEQTNDQDSSESMLDRENDAEQALDSQADCNAYLELQDNEDDENVQEMTPPLRPSTNPRRRLQISVSASPTAQTKGRRISNTHFRDNPVHIISSSDDSNEFRRKVSNTKSAPHPAAVPISSKASISANSSLVSLAAMTSNLVGMASIVPSQLTMSSSSSLTSSMVNFNSRLAASRVNSSALSVISSSAGVSRMTVSDDCLAEEVMGNGTKRGSTELWSPMKGGPLIVARNRSGLLKDNPYHEDPVLVRQRSQRVSDPEPEVYIPPENIVVLCRRRVERWRRRHADVLGKFLYAILLGAANAYVISALWHHFNKTKSLNKLSLCDGAGLLLAVVAMFYCAIFYTFVIKKLAVSFITDKTRHWSPFLERVKRIIDNEYAKAAFDLLAFSAFVVAFIGDAKNSPERMRAGIGLCLFLTLAFLISKRPNKIRWTFISRGIIFQVIITYVILNTTPQLESFECIRGKLKGLHQFPRLGTKKAFGFLSSGAMDPNHIGIPSPPANTSRLANLNRRLQKSPLTVTTEPVLAFEVISSIFFASFMIEALYFFGVIPWLVSHVGSTLKCVFGTSAVGMASAVAHVFMPNTIVALAMHKYLPSMTVSQLHLVLSCGFAASSSGLLKTVDLDGASMKMISYITLVSIPAAITISKLVYPEASRSSNNNRILQREMSQASQLSAAVLVNNRKEAANFLDAVTDGSAKAINVVMSVIANVICIVACVALVQVAVRFFGSALGYPGASLEDLLTVLLLPVAWAIGVSYDDCWNTAHLLANRLVLVQPYDHHSELLLSSLTDRSAKIATIVLSGSANPVTMGTQLGSFMALMVMTMDGRVKLGGLIVRAFLTGYLASLVTGAICGMLMD